MSLSKRLYLGLILVLILVFFSTLSINVINTSHFIEKQLQAHAQDTATSLGLSITPFIGIEEELPTIDAMVSAIFDRGYYQHVILKSNSGKIVLERHNPLEIDDVPNWFMKLFPLSPPKGVTEVFDGWVQPKTLEITSHPGFGYLKLWHSAVNSFWMILGLFILTGSLVYLALQTITKPIKRAAQQADEICQGNFVQVSNIPKPIELNLFVNAMNRMSRILQNMFNELTQQTEKYQKFAFVDELTQLPNRRAFNNQFESTLNDQEKAASGYLLIIRLSSLDAVNKSQGYTAGDEYVLSAAQNIQNVIKEIGISAKAYRIAGADFSILLEQQSKSDCENFACQLISHLNHCASYFNREIDHQVANKVAHIGITAFVTKDKASELLASADNALVQALHNKKGWQFSAQEMMPKGNTLWKEQLDSLLSNDSVQFAAQSVKDINNNTVYKELYARFNHTQDDTPIPMGQLILVAERLNLASDFDKLVITKALTQLRRQPENIAINISPASLQARSFTLWLIETVSQLENNAQLITFEISEQCLHSNTDNVFELCKQLKSLGCQITLEHFGATTSSFAHLMQIKPDFVKIDGSYCQGVENSQENQQFIQSLTSIAHSLHIKVIAELIETPAQKEQLTTLFVDYFQGYCIEQPGRW